MLIQIEVSPEDAETLLKQILTPVAEEGTWSPANASLGSPAAHVHIERPGEDDPAEQ